MIGKQTKGLTLVELVLVVALIVVVAGLMFTFLGQGLTLFSINTESADEQQNLRQVLSEITNIARLTDSEDISCSSNELTIGSRTYSLTGDEVLRNDAVIARGIIYFEASINNNLLHITIRNNKGSEMSTSLSLAG